MSTPHTLPPRWLRAAWLPELWWRLRGVRVDNYRTLCSRCGRTGQAHWQLAGCFRFRGGST